MHRRKKETEVSRSRAVAMSRDEMFKRNKGAKKDRLKRRKTEVETRVKKLFKESGIREIVRQKTFY